MTENVGVESMENDLCKSAIEILAGLGNSNPSTEHLKLMKRILTIVAFTRFLLSRDLNDIVH